MGDARDRVEGQVARLLAEHPPAEVSPEAFWGAQFDLGLAWVHFPEGRGGMDADPKLQDLVDSRLREAGAPSNTIVNFMGVGMAGPTIVAHGTDEQRDRLLRPLFTCEEIWCQLFSEPGAGSDLAALSTTAVREGDGWVVNGQKVWTTLAHVARWAMLLARTDPDVPKHAGLTYFLVDMEADGVEVRPLRQLTGEAEFNEVYLTDVRIPDDMRVGEVGQGWAVAMATLMNERVALGDLGNQPRGSGPIRHAIREFRQRDGDEAQRDELVRLWVEGELTRLTALRAQAARDRCVPGPEGAVGKLAMTEFNQSVWSFVTTLRGLDATLVQHYEMLRPTVMSEEVLGDRDDIDLTKAFLTTRGTSIGGGTTQIARNILAERVLGLPGDVRVDKDVAWRDVPRS
jgi:alkylation response protein AidB-like acyl-CoA dehydrogenase